MSWELDDLDSEPECSDPPSETCADAGCPVHGWDDEYDEFGEQGLA